jgi:hypothetical protein
MDVLFTPDGDRDGMRYRGTTRPRVRDGRAKPGIQGAAVARMVAPTLRTVSR